MNFKGAAKRLDDIDLPRIGDRIGVGEDEIHAVLDVETTGSGFDSEGRPKILFEPHVFYRNLSGTRRDRAVAQGLAARSWGTLPYGKTSEQYPKLLRAMQIDETAALKACSWGLGQILGENHLAAGYDSPQAMVQDFIDDEEKHLEAMVHFIAANHLDDELRDHNWAAFARGYNGSGYAKHGYHTRLAAAFARWSKIRDTPWQPDKPGKIDITPAQPAAPTAPSRPREPVPPVLPGADPAPPGNLPEIPDTSPPLPPSNEKPGPLARFFAALVAAFLGRGQP